MNTKPFSPQRRNNRLLSTVFTVLVCALVAGGVAAHNLQTKFVYLFFDPDTQQLLEDRMNTPGWLPPEPLIQDGDELGFIIKVVPQDGTTTGVGGHVDFYVPNGTQVIDAAYIIPGNDPSDGLNGYDKIPMKGQSLIAEGAGPVGGKTTSELAGLGTHGPNIIGVSADPVDGSGTHRHVFAVKKEWAAIAVGEPLL